MSQLTIYAEIDPDKPLLQTDDIEAITDELSKVGIRIERWKADRELADDADNETGDAEYVSGTHIEYQLFISSCRWIKPDSQTRQRAARPCEARSAVG